MCIKIYSFNLKKATNQQHQQKKHKPKKAKKNNERKKEIISGKLIKRNKFAAARVKIFLVTRISGKKSIIFLAL